MRLKNYLKENARVEHDTVTVFINKEQVTDLQAFDASLKEYGLQAKFTGSKIRVDGPKAQIIRVLRAQGISHKDVELHGDTPRGNFMRDRDGEEFSTGSERKSSRFRDHFTNAKDRIRASRDRYGMTEGKGCEIGWYVEDAAGKNVAGPFDTEKQAETECDKRGGDAKGFTVGYVSDYASKRAKMAEAKEQDSPDDIISAQLEFVVEYDDIPREKDRTRKNIAAVVRKYIGKVKGADEVEVTCVMVNGPGGGNPEIRYTGKRDVVKRVFKKLYGDGSSAAEFNKLFNDCIVKTQRAVKEDVSNGGVLAQFDKVCAQLQWTPVTPGKVPASLEGLINHLPGDLEYATIRDVDADDHNDAGADLLYSMLRTERGRTVHETRSESVTAYDFPDAVLLLFKKYFHGNVEVTIQITRVTVN